ncbi:2,3,4,5-tetrahydropyridine-2,6-dicarboxylate N-succinyltransferase [bacterium]|nr:2,3,4,5-tetrahydropyridine-2,6-dicarboxylate N-succinyltransferase [bacterium]
MNLIEMQKKIEDLYLQKEFNQEQIQTIENGILQLDQGKLRVSSQKEDGNWNVNEWVKKLILLYFRVRKIEKIENGPFDFIDKIPVKKWTGSEGVRIVPQAMARFGSYIESGAVLMPSYINIGAFVGSGTMIDTWATVGSCAYVGKSVHVSGGVGIGGVLEPLQAKPVIVEDHAFIGSRCILVEGVHVAQGAVLGAGVTITGSTKIIDVSASQTQTYSGHVPANSVVIPGTMDKSFPGGTYGVPCALIIGKRKPSTDLKTSLNEALRNFEVSV